MVGVRPALPVKRPVRNIVRLRPGRAEPTVQARQNPSGSILVMPGEILDVETVRHSRLLFRGTSILRSPKVPLAGQRIRIAEDESLIALELEGILEGFGCTVVGPVSRIEEVLPYVRM